MNALILAVLTTQLGSEDFGTRERAHKALADLGPAAHSHLWIAERSKCPEVRARARRMLSGWYSENAEKLAAAHAPFPWWSWTANWPDTTDEYMKAARKIVGYGKRPDYIDERMAAQLLVADMYRQQYSRQAIEGWLADRWKDEQDWKAKFMQPPTPPQPAEPPAPAPRASPPANSPAPR